MGSPQASCNNGGEIGGGEGDSCGGSGGTAAAAAAAAGGVLGADSDALSTEAVTEVCTSAFDSVADLRMQLEEELAVPEALKRGGRRRGDGGQHELIYRGQLLGEHLFLGDYDINDGDLLHFAVHTGGRAR